MAGQVVQLKHIGYVTFSQNRRSKFIKVSVKPDKSVLVSYPFFVSSKEVLAFVQKNEKWILQQQEKMDSRKTKVEFGSEIKTKLHSITFLEGPKNKCDAKGETVKIYSPDFSSEEGSDFTEYCLTTIYRIEAKRLLPVRLKQLADKFGFQFNKVSIRNNRRNWGSCSSQNNISLNLQMMKLPVELIDYILLHELVHTEIKNHGPGFWKRLNEITGNGARELSAEVKKYSTYTL